MMSKRRAGVSLRVDVEGPVYETPSYGAARLQDVAEIVMAAL